MMNPEGSQAGAFYSSFLRTPDQGSGQAPESIPRNTGLDPGSSPG